MVLRLKQAIYNDMNIAVFSGRPSYIIWWAIFVHLAWGSALMLDPGIVPVVILVGLHWIVALGLSGPSLGLLLVVAAIAAAISLILDRRQISNTKALLLLLPQYALLVAAFVSDTQSVLTGQVAGQQVDRLLLFTVLWPVMVAALLHTLAIIQRHVVRPAVARVDTGATIGI